MSVITKTLQQSLGLVRASMLIIFIAWLISVVLPYYWLDDNKKSSPLPKEASQQMSMDSLSIQQLPLPPAPIKQSTSSAHPLEKRPTAKQQIQTQAARSASHTVQSSKKTLPPQSTQQLYQQLSSQGIDIQIAWPQNSVQRQAILDFMYQCVGSQFAVLNGNNITHLNQSKVQNFSTWIRIAQGSLSVKEQHWLAAFSVTGTPIRLFPRQIDWQLAKYIAQSLHGNELTSFRATYQLTNQKLQLTDIRLNAQPINKTWLLYQKKC